VTFVLRHYSARARFWLWTFASIKFLIPFAFLTILGSHLPQLAAPSVIVPPMQTITKVVQPFAFDGRPPTDFSPLSEPLDVSASEAWVRRLAYLWLFGAVWMFAWWILQWQRLCSTCRSARSAEGAFGQSPIPVLLASGSVESGVFGIFHPVLLLPADIADRLSSAQLQAVIAHELVHVERRDNLWAAVHSLVQMLFWFHPVVWWIGGRLVAEREQACDEAVLARGADAEEC
jgi:beta-lactamase regulating signal transducer with metallopeptidase domain